MPIHYNGPPEIRAALDTFVKLSRAAESVHHVLARQLEETGLTPSQFGVLEALYHLGPLRQCTLAEKLLKSGGNLTRVIDNLERAGLVERRQDAADRRAFQVHLTESGQKKIQKIFPAHAREIQRLFSCLNPGEQEQLAALCRRLGHSLQKQVTTEKNIQG